MFDIQREELIWAGRKLVLETGRMARQADGAVLASYGFGPAASAVPEPASVAVLGLALATVVAVRRRRA